MLATKIFVDFADSQSILCYIQKELEKKEKNQPLKPNGAKLSAKDRAIRDSWKPGTKIEVYASGNQWGRATIHWEVNDVNGKYLSVEYDRNGEKEMIGRYDADARPLLSAQDKSCKAIWKSIENAKELTR